MARVEAMEIINWVEYSNTFAFAGKLEATLTMHNP